jgi:hypothetical protein
MPPRKASSAKKSAAKKNAARTVAAKKRTAAAKATSSRARSGMTTAHKTALARGREEARAVKLYLDAISVPPRRGRQRTPESIQRQLAGVDEKLRTARSMERLNLLKERRDLEAARAELAPKGDLASTERAFVRVARSYGARKGIDYSLWREAGVPPQVLTKAKVPRTSGAQR